MIHSEQWGGLYEATTADGIVHDSARLYQDEDLWSSCQLAGFACLSALDSKAERDKLVNEIIPNAFDTLASNRQQDTMMGILCHHTLDSTKFKTKWIVEKNSKG